MARPDRDHSMGWCFVHRDFFITANPRGLLVSVSAVGKNHDKADKS